MSQSEGGGVGPLWEPRDAPRETGPQGSIVRVHALVLTSEDDHLVHAGLGHDVHLLGATKGVEDGVS